MATLRNFVVVGLCEKCKATEMCTDVSYLGLIGINN